MILQGLRHLDGTTAIGIGLHHTDHLRLGLQERTEIVQVLHHRIEVHLQDCLVHLLHQLVGNQVEAVFAGTLQQDHLTMQLFEEITL